jgi:hypothetical protein
LSRGGVLARARDWQGNGELENRPFDQSAY